jgi:hypothetical protein
MHGARSHTDTLTNVVVLSALDIGRHFDEIVERDLPIGTLPTFLHEATHHWCLDTPVGIALHLLSMRARRAAVAAHAGSVTHDAGWDLLDIVVRYELVRDFMRPLSEGIALFAEHDAIPGATKVISTPLVTTGALYGRGYAFSESETFGGLPYVLAAARVSREHVRRKAGLLLESMTCDKGGYLPGYLLVKHLWGIACTTSSLFLDSDFFLQYLRAHMFNDWVLVARLLDDSVKDVGAMQGIAEHIAGRLRHFRKVAIHGDRPKLFETMSFENRGETMHVSTDVVSMDLGFLPIEESEDATIGRRRLADGIRAHFASWSGDENQDALLFQDRNELYQRSVVNLGTVAVRATFRSDGLHLRLASGRRARIPVEYFSKRLSFDDRPLDVDFLATGSKGQLCLLVTDGSDVIALLPFGKSEVPASLRDTVTSGHARSAHVRLSRELIDSALKRARVNDHHASMLETVAETLNDWFIPLALIRVEASRLPALKKRTARHGLLDLLDRDKGLLLDTAAASLCVPSPFDFNSVASFHTWSAGTPTASIIRINERIRQTLGFEPFPFTDAGVLLGVSLL